MDRGRGGHVRVEGEPMAAPDRRSALDHVVVVVCENRSFDNRLCRLYQPGEAAS
jgi:phospholipase C